MEQVGNFLLIKSRECKVIAEVLQFRHFDSKQLIIPACVKSHAIIGKYVRLLLCICQVIGIHTGYFDDTLGFRSHESAMSCDNVVVLVDDNRIYETELTQGRAYLVYLFGRVSTGIVDVRYQLIGSNKLKLGSSFHLSVLLISFFIPLRASK